MYKCKKANCDRYDCQSIVVKQDSDCHGYCIGLWNNTGYSLNEDGIMLRGFNCPFFKKRKEGKNTITIEESNSIDELVNELIMEDEANGKENLNG